VALALSHVCDSLRPRLPSAVRGVPYLVWVLILAAEICSCTGTITTDSFWCMCEVRPTLPPLPLTLNEVVRGDFQLSKPFQAPARPDPERHGRRPSG
jgi:hypothetical protein